MEITIPKMITINLPIRAISKDNEKIMNRSGRFFLSKKYKDFEKIVQQYFKVQYPHFNPLEGDLFIEIHYYFKDLKHCDLFNLPKSLMDALQGYLFKNDRQIKSAVLHIIYDKKERIEIYCSEIGEDK